MNKKISNVGNGRSKGNGRTRNWTIIVYPESAPDNWREIIDMEHIPWIESPLHNKDINITGEIKKEHWHVLLCFEGVKTFEQVRELTEKINSPIPQKCAAAKALVRYMLHMDNPEKHQYNISDLKGHGGVDITDMLKPTGSDRYMYIKEMIEYIKENKIDEFQDLLDYAATERYEDWFVLLCDNSSYIVGNYIKSLRHRKERSEKIVIIDKDSGEIL
jgi:hypothetical protein